MVLFTFFRSRKLLIFCLNSTVRWRKFAIEVIFYSTTCRPTFLSHGVRRIHVTSCASSFYRVMTLQGLAFIGWQLWGKFCSGWIIGVSFCRSFTPKGMMIHTHSKVLVPFFAIKNVSSKTVIQGLQRRILTMIACVISKCYLYQCEIKIASLVPDNV